MREILFKAKRIDSGEWVEGYYVKCRGKHYILQAYNENGYDERWELSDWIEINSETLCEFTGLTDNNGKMIWENDIVMHCAENKLALVEFINGQFSIQKYGYWLQSSDNFEVICNKFDNPELLTKE